MCQSPRGHRPPTRSVAVQKEVCTFGPDGRTKTVMLVDAAQQTGEKSATVTSFILLLKASWSATIWMVIIQLCVARDLL